MGLAMQEAEVLNETQEIDDARTGAARSFQP
jgi:hypothetical protein